MRLDVYHLSAANDRIGAWRSERLGSPFFTADVARLASGGWTVIEINDGGSSSFPEQLDPRDFYRPVVASRG